MNRGEHRLQIAARLLMPPADTGADALARIKTLPKPEADRLRGLVDWVEEYEHHEAGSTRGGRDVAPRAD